MKFTQCTECIVKKSNTTAADSSYPIKTEDETFENFLLRDKLQYPKIYSDLKWLQSYAGLPYQMHVIRTLLLSLSEEEKNEAWDPEQTVRCQI